MSKKLVAEGVRAKGMRTKEFAKKLLVAFITNIATSCLDPSYGTKVLDDSCNPPAYVKVVKEENNEKYSEVSKSISAVGESILLRCGVKASIMEIDVGANQVVTSISIKNEDVSLNAVDGQYIECSSEYWKSSVVFERTGKRISTLLVYYDGNTKEINEGETIQLKERIMYKDWEITSVDFVRGLFTKDNHLVIHFNLNSSKGNPIKIFMSAPIENIYTNAGLKIEYTPIVIQGIALCAQH
ncbi:MAG: hypothetical protein ACPL0A_02765 [Candidatus Micrarchaeia archaeon]